MAIFPFTTTAVIVAVGWVLIMHMPLLVDFPATASKGVVGVLSICHLEKHHVKAMSRAVTIHVTVDGSK